MVSATTPQGTSKYFSAHWQKGALSGNTVAPTVLAHHPELYSSSFAYGITGPTNLSQWAANNGVAAAQVGDSLALYSTVTNRLLLLSRIGSTAITPMPGIWAIDQEINGKPGRGFGLESHNGILFLTVYAYDHSGADRFFTAVGPLNDNTFVADLTQYNGGTAFGGVHKPATAVGSPGQVKIVFVDSSHGAIQFPGEQPKSISKLSW